MKVVTKIIASFLGLLVLTSCISAPIGESLETIYEGEKTPPIRVNEQCNLPSEVKMIIETYASSPLSNPITLFITPINRPIWNKKILVKDNRKLLVDISNVLIASDTNNCMQTYQLQNYHPSKQNYYLDNNFVLSISGAENPILCREVEVREITSVEMPTGLMKSSEVHLRVCIDTSNQLIYIKNGDK